LESIGFTSQTDLDPCLFVSDKVICLVYVDDTLLYSPQEEYIDPFIGLLRSKDMDLEVEGAVAGFLGVHIARTTTSITLTQTGLIDQIIEAVGVHNLPIKYTPALATPLVKDEDG
jgi:hypothetical protein